MTVRATGFLAAGALAALAACSAATSSGGTPASPSATTTTTGTAAAAGARNGEEKKSGTQIAADAKAALIAAGSTHTTGTGSSNGKPIKIDVKVQGSNTSGSFEQGGVPAQIVVVGASTYLKGDSRLYAQVTDGATVAKIIGDRWLKLPEGQGTGLGFTVEALAASVDPQAGVTATTVGTDTLDGQPAVVVSRSDGSRLYVAATGKPYPLREIKGGGDPGTVTFSDFGTDFRITAPTNVLDLATAG